MDPFSVRAATDAVDRDIAAASNGAIQDDVFERLGDARLDVAGSGARIGSGCRQLLMSTRRASGVRSTREPEGSTRENDIERFSEGDGMARGRAAPGRPRGRGGRASNRAGHLLL